MKQKKSLLKRRRSRKRKSVRKKFDSGFGFLDSIFDFFSPTSEIDDENTKLKNKFVKILRKYETNKITKKDVWKETVNVLKTMNLPEPVDEFWTKNDVGIINWYITQIPDSKKDIKYSISQILSTVNP
jgi:hypothetical protein